MITEIEPRRLFYYFNEICALPRPSKHEGHVVEYLRRFGAAHGLETIVDEAGNVVIRKGASAGYEGRQPVCLQAHMDMVCEKNGDTVHDFMRDAIQPYVDGDWLKAKGTTLGADDGIGMAAILAVLEDDSIEHGPIEGLFTVDEETGLTGAFAMKADVLRAHYLLNLDSEDDGELCIGCAGGIDTVARFHYELEPAEAKAFYFTLAVSGGMGGHSGDDINKGRANANKVLVNFLHRIAEETELRIARIDGGNLRNAIAREAVVTGCVPFGYKEDLRVALNHYVAEVEEEFGDVEKSLSIRLESEVTPEYVLDRRSSAALIEALFSCPHGVIAMSKEIEGLVETSTNLASVKMKEGNSIVVATSQRSSVDAEKRAIARRVEEVFTAQGAEVSHSDGYPGWAPNPHSKLVAMATESYRRLFGEEMVVRAIHAGLECGLFLEKYPDMEMVSFGPTMRGVHSPDERLNIPTTLKFWQFLIETLKNLD